MVHPLVRFLAAVAGSLAMAQAADLDAPIARTVDVSDKAFGLTLPDPYRWMEGENNIEFEAWLKAQGAYGRSKLDALPRLPFWRADLDKVARSGVINQRHKRVGDRVFFIRLIDGREGALMVRDANGTERILFDPQTQKAGTLTPGITEYSPSPDGKLVAVDLQQGGAEITDIHVINVTDASISKEIISEVWGEFRAIWLPDGSGFTYTQLAATADRDRTDPLLNMRVRLHHLGTNPDSDPVLLARGTNPRVPLDAHEFPSIDVEENSDFAMLLIVGARSENRACIAPRSEAIAPGAHWKCPVGYEDNVQGEALYGNHLYLASMKGHPNGQLLLRSLDKAGNSAAATVALPEDTAASLADIRPATDGLYVKRMRGGPDEILRLSYAGGAPVKISSPYLGATYLFDTDPRAAGLLFSLQGWTQPRSVYLAGAEREALVDLKLGADSPADYSDIVAEEVVARSADGTAVPLTILHTRGQKMPSQETAILEGYGAYGSGLQPHFAPFVLEWVKAGHVYAIAHVRGGNEKGDRWRITGSRGSKERGVEDFIACAESLVAQGYAAHGRVVAWGGSAGGILIGGALTRDPHAFGAAVIQAGMLNPSRLAASKNGANQYAEFGDPHTAEGLGWLAAMDPYQRLKPNSAYPPLLLILGLNDNRVSPWNSGKFGARLMAIEKERALVWYRTDQDMGHFNTAQSAAALELADFYSFAESTTAK